MGLDIATTTKGAAQAATNASPWGAIASEGMGLLGGIVGMIGQRKREDRAMRNQEKLMGIQQQNQMMLNQQSKDLALQQWKDTNYGPQVEEMRKAGLNPALLYGMSGGGGATTGGAQGGSAASGNAPAPQPMPMDMASMMQMSLIAAQKALMEAQANKTNVEAKKLEGADTENVNANTALTKTLKAIEDINLSIKDETRNTVVTKIGAETNSAIGQAKSNLTKGNIDETTYQDQIKQIVQTAIGTTLNNKLIKANTNLTETQTKAIADTIAIGYINAYANQRNANSNETNATTQLRKQMADVLYQNGVIDLGEQKVMIDALSNIIGIATGKVPNETPRGKVGY
jgi:hypothetical protein